MSFFRYLTFDRYFWINQHVQYCMLVQYLQHSWQMKELLLEINISFYLEKIDKLFKLQRHFVWNSQWCWSCINYSIHVGNPDLQMPLWPLPRPWQASLLYNLSIDIWVILISYQIWQESIYCDPTFNYISWQLVCHHESFKMVQNTHKSTLIKEVYFTLDYNDLVCMNLKYV